MRPTWPPAAAPQAAAGAEPTSTVFDLVVLTELEVKMSLRNVIYYNSSNDQISLAGIAQLPYTDVIIANLQPTSPSNLTLAGWGPAFDDNLRSNIQALKSAGKNVLISFGGANNANLLSGYQSYAQNVGGLVDDIVNNWVLKYGFNGVDIDYEDDSGFDQPGQPASYDGAGFLVALTNGLYQALPSGQNIITHAPSPPFWDPQGGYYAANTQIAAYTQIWQQAGNQIAWINCQFYDNQSYDQTAALKVSWYQQIAEIMGRHNNCSLARWLAIRLSTNHQANRTKGISHLTI